MTQCPIDCFKNNIISLNSSRIFLDLSKVTITIKNGEVRTDQILVIGYLSISSNNLPHLLSSGFYSLISLNLYQFKNVVKLNILIY